MPDPSTLPQRQTIRTIVAGTIGNSLEWYDFGLFAYFAGVIGDQFFPSESRFASLLGAFGIFAIGFLMRPVGGMLFGHIGDRLGRKRALEVSVLMMAIPTTCLGLLPNYHAIGIWAPLLLTLIRILQGLSVGGEFIGSIAFLGEIAAPGRRGLVSSWSMFSGTAGTMLGSGAAALVMQLPPDDVQAWGWRIPFLAGIFAGIFGLWIRLGLPESPCFAAAQRAGDVADLPVVETLRRDRRAIVFAVGLALMNSVGFYLPFVWLPTYLMEINQPPLASALAANTLAMVVQAVGVPLAGMASDRVGRRPILLAGTIGYALLAYPLFLLAAQGTFAAALTALVGFTIVQVLATAPSAAAMVELFPTRTRTSGMAIGYNGTLAVLGGTTPAVATWLIEATGRDYAPALYLAACAAAATVIIFFMRETVQSKLA